MARDNVRHRTPGDLDIVSRFRQGMGLFRQGPGFRRRSRLSLG